MLDSPTFRHLYTYKRTRTQTSLMDIGMQHADGHTADMDIHHGHGHAASTWTHNMDMGMKHEHGHAPWTWRWKSTMDAGMPIKV